MKALNQLMLVSAVAALAACKEAPAGDSATSTTGGEFPVESFGKLPDGTEAHLYTLTNAAGMTAKVSDFGATLVSLTAPDKDGHFADVTHGYTSVSGYDNKDNPYFGASVGRFGNRIAHGKFSLDGQEYTLATNNEPGGIPCHLHGGDVGFNRRMWTVKSSELPSSITFEYISKDGEEGYPGTLTSTITYTLTDANELKWEATATTDKPTVINLVHHSYWNLSGDQTTSINDHILTLPADKYLPTDAGLIPTGELAPVAGTPMDFNSPTAIGERVEQDFEALKLGGGYDHCWVLTNPDTNGLALAARVKDPKSGRVLEVSSNQPAVQFYGGNFLDGTLTGKNGDVYGRRTALCLETEGFPDAPNHPEFPSAVLKPGETYHHVMVHKFSAE
ncbi:aldose 1-epimerase [Haloferula luteola]|uniref:Aldose 1-epimerase n=1 Tax=Haloferula luteola TaxID=595692 RepID=A0A840UYU9_9BACT|nr:aldose epimerase family protein [Haloferula luteola]MBB5351307.1 aldose 1-epimerase [Haloferula luteola]